MKQPLKLGASNQCSSGLWATGRELFFTSPLLLGSQAPASVVHPQLCLWLSVTEGPLVCLARLWLEDLCIQHVITAPTLSSEVLSLWLIVCPLICSFTTQPLCFMLLVLFFLPRLSSLSRSSGISLASLSAFLRVSPPVLALPILIFSKCLYVISWAQSCALVSSVSPKQ